VRLGADGPSGVIYLTVARSARRAPPAAGRVLNRTPLTGLVHCSRPRCGRRLAPLSPRRRDRLAHRTRRPAGLSCEAGSPGPWHNHALKYSSRCGAPSLWRPAAPLTHGFSHV